MQIKYVLAALVAAALTCAVIAWTMLPAAAHDAPAGWSYDASCCHGDSHSGDCQEIPDSAVKPVDGGYVVTLLPGDHRRVTVAHTWQRAMSEARRSPDGHYHACLWPNEATLRCFYAPPFGS